MNFQPHRYQIIYLFYNESFFNGLQLKFNYIDKSKDLDQKE